MTTKEERDKEWEEEKVSRSEMLTLMLPLVLSSASLNKCVTKMARAMMESEDEELKIAGAKSLYLADDAMTELREFQTKFQELADSADVEEGSGDGTPSQSR